MATLEALAQSAATFGGDSFKEELALQERLDAAIDRKIKRLIMIKASKPILGLTSAQRAESNPKKLVEKNPPRDSDFIFPTPPDRYQHGWLPGLRGERA
jgi:hypothetical protein